MGLIPIPYWPHSQASAVFVACSMEFAIQNCVQILYCKPSMLLGASEQGCTISPLDGRHMVSRKCAHMMVIHLHAGLYRARCLGPEHIQR